MPRPRVIAEGRGTTLNVYLDVATYDAVSAEALRRNVSMGYVVREKLGELRGTPDPVRKLRPIPI